MAKQNKTIETTASVAGYIKKIADEKKRKDVSAIIDLMAKQTKFEPRMWGPGIVGFGSYHYKYESGREGDSCLTGFSSRKSDISVYLVASFPGQKGLLSKLGRHKMGGGCLHIRKLGDVDLKVLEQLVVGSVAERKRRHG